MATIGHTKAAPVAWTRAGRRALFGSLIVVAGLGFAGSLVTLSPLFAGDFSGVSTDVNMYVAYTRTWLATGDLYAPAQLAGPYVVEQVNGNVYPPSLLYLTVPFALGLPMILWYAIPALIAGASLWKLRPPRWALVALGVFLVCYPRWWIVVMLGNPAIWTFAFLLAGLAWGWPAVLVAVKLTFAPLALLGIRDRRWWLLAGVALLACIPFAHLWLDFATVLANTRSERGLPYVLGEWPIALAILGLGYVSRGATRAGSATAPSRLRLSVPASG